MDNPHQFLGLEKKGGASESSQGQIMCLSLNRLAYIDTGVFTSF